MWTDDDLDDVAAAPFLGVSEEPEADGEWTPEHGFPSAGDVVRLWVDEEGIPTRLRISLNWREHLKNTTLQQAINQALVLSQSYTNRPTFSAIDLSTVPEAKQPLSEDAFRKLVKEVDALEVEQEELLASAAQAPREDFDAGTGTAAEGKIRVTMDPSGFIRTIAIDEEWAREDARVAEINEGVKKASREAKDNFVPQQRSSELDRIQQRRRDLIGQMRAMLIRGFD